MRHTYNKFDMNNNIYHIADFLRRFEGQDVWVKLDVGSDLYYIRILSIDDTTLKCNVFNYTIVDGEPEGWYLRYELRDFLDSGCPYEIFMFDLYDIEIPYNVECYTTAEILEILRSNLRRWLNQN